MASITKIERNRRLKLWIKALRSGKYKQTTGRLRRDNLFCCLGVACDVYAKQTKRGKWEDTVFISTRTGRGETSDELPKSVSNWFGLDGVSNPTVVDEHDRTFSCIAANDNEEWNFKRIADSIERTYIKKGKS